MRLEIVQSDALDGARNWSTSIDPTIDPTIRGSNLCAKAISCTTACDRRAMKRNHWAEDPDLWFGDRSWLLRLLHCPRIPLRFPFDSAVGGGAIAGMPSIKVI